MVYRAGLWEYQRRQFRSHAVRRDGGRNHKAVVRAQHDDGCPADGHVDHAIRHHGLPRQRGRDEHGGRHPAAEFCGARPPVRPAGPCAAAARHRRRSAGSHVHVEQRRAPRGLPRGAVDGRRPAHPEHQARPRPDRLHRHARGRHRGHRGRLARPALRGGAAARHDDPARDRHRYGGRVPGTECGAAGPPGPGGPLL